MKKHLKPEAKALLIALPLVFISTFLCSRCAAEAMTEETTVAGTPVIDKLLPCLIEQQPTYPRIVTEPAKTSLGEFRVTVYTPYDDGGKWGYQTATGTTSEHLRTCAVDPKVIPLGTELEIKGEKMSLTVKAVDTGSAVKGKRIDLFFDGTVEEALQWAEAFGDYGIVFKK